MDSPFIILLIAVNFALLAGSALQWRKLYPAAIKDPSLEGSSNFFKRTTIVLVILLSILCPLLFWVSIATLISNAIIAFGASVVSAFLLFCFKEAGALKVSELFSAEKYSFRNLLSIFLFALTMTLLATAIFILYQCFEGPGK